ncbi:hypothetical protein AB0I69_00510 [Streptomyces sp. NPDC050508]|uniref:hypothetical protein n=1 Tax=Streptomyces sp. NPDC050508 TaxID=3155405 RepID=UPI0034203DC4
MDCTGVAALDLGGISGAPMQIASATVLAAADSGTFAVAKDNQGHYGTTMSSGLFGTDPTLKVGFGCKSEHQLAVVAQDIVERFYGEAASLSYPSAPGTRRSAAGATGSG